MTSVLEKTYREFVAKKDVASFIKFFSIMTWEKIGFVRRQKRLKFHEVTVTQNLLFQFRILSEAFPTAVEMFEAINEKTNGNDIELFIKTKEGYVFFACQAKIAHKSKNGIYTSIEHPTGPRAKIVRQQIESLIEYADGAPATISGTKKGIPIYLFYNYSDNKTTRTAVQSATTDDIEVYGCSYINARKLVGKTYYDGTGWITKPSFSLLHPKMGQPFYKLFNHIGKSRIDLWQAITPLASGEELSEEQAPAYDLLDAVAYYERPRLNDRDSNYWVPITTALSDEPFNSSTQIKVYDEAMSPEFNPKYRLIFNDSEIDTSLAHWLFM